MSGPPTPPPLSPGEAVQVTAILTHLAGIAESLPLRRYQLYLSEQAWKQSRQDVVFTSSVAHEGVMRAMRLREAVIHARRLVDAVNQAQAYLRALTAEEDEEDEEDDGGEVVPLQRAAHLRAVPDPEGGDGGA